MQIIAIIKPAIAKPLGLRNSPRNHRINPMTREISAIGCNIPNKRPIIESMNPAKPNPFEPFSLTITVFSFVILFYLQKLFKDLFL